MPRSSGMQCVLQPLPCVRLLWGMCGPACESGDRGGVGWVGICASVLDIKHRCVLHAMNEQCMRLIHTPLTR